MKFKGELTNGLLDHVIGWAKEYRKTNYWTKWDTNALNTLYMLKKRVGQEAYERQKARKKKKAFISKIKRVLLKK